MLKESWMDPGIFMVGVMKVVEPSDQSGRVGGGGRGVYSASPIRDY